MAELAPETVGKKSVKLLSCLCNQMNCSPPGSYAFGILQARILATVIIPFSRASFLSNPGIEPRSPALQADSLPPEPPETVRRRGREEMGWGRA